MAWTQGRKPLWTNLWKGGGDDVMKWLIGTDKRCRQDIEPTALLRYRHWVKHTQSYLCIRSYTKHIYIYISLFSFRHRVHNCFVTLRPETDVCHRFHNITNNGDDGGGGGAVVAQLCRLYLKHLIFKLGHLTDCRHCCWCWQWVLFRKRKWGRLSS